ncbi:trypco2 family protein [Streptomyces polyrhachis]|uniref:Trypco2 family protein n=1 Tax=Streptomyces polyrhachis TaxID=1282885 RepID=A0ABW2GHJ8_9ACTN
MADQEAGDADVENAVELADVIAQLRSELNRAVSEGADQGLRFQLGMVNVELEVVVERSREAGGKARFWVLDAQGSARSTRLSTQRLTLALQPTHSDTPGAPVLISDDQLPDER